MRLRILCCAVTLVCVCPAFGQSAPLVDHHQHLFSPEIAKLISAEPLPAVELPPDLAALLEARGRAALDKAALSDLYTEDAWLMQSFNPGWIKGRDAVVGWWIQSTREQIRITPLGWSVEGPAGHIAAYLTEEDKGSPRHSAHLLISVRKGADGRWRIAAESLTAPGPAVINPISASDVIALLDAAGTKRALILSVAYIFGSPNRNVENEYQKVKAENDWTSRQVAQYPGRLRGFCSFNPLRDYALQELARCANDPHLRYGLKLHFGNSVVDYHNPQHIEQVRRVFRAANEQRMAIVVHMRASLSKRLPYGREEARIFLNELLPAAPDVPVQIAHLTGTQRYSAADPPVDEALAVFAEAIEKNDPRTKRLLFDVTTNVALDISAEQAKLIAKRIRQLGVGRVLYGSDAAAGGNLPPRQGWAAFRQLPLTDQEFRTIANNVAPYMR